VKIRVLHRPSMPLPIAATAATPCRLPSTSRPIEWTRLVGPLITPFTQRISSPSFTPVMAPLKGRHLLSPPALLDCLRLPPTPIKGCPGCASPHLTLHRPPYLISRSRVHSQHKPLAATTFLRRLVALLLPVSGEWTIELPVRHSPLPCPWSLAQSPGVAVGQAPMSSHGQQWRPVHGGPVSRLSMTHGLSSQISQFKNKSENQLSYEFCKDTPGFLLIKL
jgi:hypothetical protein